MTIHTLETKEGRSHAERLIGAVLRDVAGVRNPVIELSEGEGQGEVAFENFMIVGQDNGEFAVSFAVEVPGTRWQPADVDVIELDVVDNLNAAVTLALKTYFSHRIDQALDNEALAIYHEIEASLLKEDQ